ncbi:MAG: hydrogenase nickel incorporation protein HypB [Bacteroidia bacterium]|nr:hydrogenase nickel incorporation protein HypB [Bacteroidia bacterium]
MDIILMKNVLDRNQNKANENRLRLSEKGILMINMISSPGSGKTTILEKTLAHFSGVLKIAVIEGDIATDHDARRLQLFDIPVIQINTEGGCHLDSHSVAKAFEHLNLDKLQLIIVENVGNLVCPAAFDLGENHKIAVISVPEGDDKPVKYPLLFRESSAIILNKTDLIPYTNFNLDRFRNYVQELNGNIPVMEISCTTGSGLQAWFDWLGNQIKEKGAPC